MFTVAVYFPHFFVSESRKCEEGEETGGKNGSPSAELAIKASRDRALSIVIVILMIHINCGPARARKKVSKDEKMILHLEKLGQKLAEKG
jgi:hypothetical protein